MTFSGHIMVAPTSFLAWGVHRARAYHSTFESARYRKQIWRRAAIFVQVLILLCEVTFGLSYIKIRVYLTLYTLKNPNFCAQ